MNPLRIVAAVLALLLPTILTAQTVTVTSDSLPVLTVTSPIPGTVARPMLRVTATCSDDDPNGCKRITVTTDPHSHYHTVEGSSIDTYITLDFWEGGNIDVRISAVDSANQVTAQLIPVHVASDRALQELAHMPTQPIFDVQPARVLYGDGQLMKIRDVASGTDTVAPAVSNYVPLSGYLAPRGAIFTSGVPGFLVRGLYELQDGVVLQHSYPSWPIRVAGNYATWSGEPGMSYTGAPPNVLSVRDLVAGTTTQIPYNVDTPLAPDVAPDGTVAFHSHPSNNVYRYKNGQFQQVATAGNGSYYYAPRIDATSTVYFKAMPTFDQGITYALMWHNGTTATEIRAPRVDQPFADYDYQVNNGWIAVTRYTAGGVRQVWRIAPGGAEEQITFFDSSSQIDKLAPNGDLTVLHMQYRYLSRPGSALLRISSYNGQAFPFDDEWYLAIGRSVYLLGDEPIGTTVTFTSSPDPSREGEPKTFTATVTPASVTGLVAFRHGQNTLGYGVVSGGVATFTTAAMLKGFYYMNAVYGGDPQHQWSVSAPAYHSVYGNTATTTTVTSSPNPSNPGQTVTFTATVTASGGTPTGQVTFYDGATPLGTGALSGNTASLMTSAIGPGPRQITATYDGDTNFAPSTSAPHTHTVLTPFGAPTNVAATATSATQVSITWTGVQSATSYEIFRRSPQSQFVSLGFAYSPVFLDNGVSPNTSYLYQVRAIGPGPSASPNSASDEATTIVFSTPVTVVSVQHFLELQNGANALRALAGLGSATFTPIASGSVILTATIQELRNALDGARAVLGLPAMAWTNPAPAGGAVKRAHVEELRDAVR